MPIHSIKQLLQELWTHLERTEPAWYTVAHHRSLHLAVHGEPCSCHPGTEPLVLYDLPAEPAGRDTNELPPGDYVVVQVEIAAAAQGASDSTLADEMSALLSESCWQADSPLRDWRYTGPRWLVRAGETLAEGEVFYRPRTAVADPNGVAAGGITDTATPADEPSWRRWTVTLYTPALDVEVIAVDETQARGLAAADPGFSQALDLFADDSVIVDAQEADEDEGEAEPDLYCDCPGPGPHHAENWDGVELTVCEQCNRPASPEDQ